MAISMLKIRRPLGRLIFNMGIAIAGKTVFLIETAPWTKWLPFRRRYFELHFREWNLWILIKILLKFVRKGAIDNNPALV